MEADGGPIPVVEMYRGVGLHDQQPPERLELVRREIDLVWAMTKPRDLFAFACNERNAPEARLFAEALCESVHVLAAETRSLRPAVNLDQLHACCAGLNSQSWRSPWRYGTLADRDAVPREVPLDGRHAHDDGGRPDARAAAAPT